MHNLRTLVVLEAPIKKLVREKAHSQGTSISQVCRDLIREALELNEDKYWNELAEKREKGFHWNKALTHAQVWKHLKKHK